MIPTKQVTLRDIASYTGYSTMLVSSAITGRGRISEEAREEIQAAARKLGYVPNISARGLRLGKSGLIALVTKGAIANLPEWLEAIQRFGCVAAVFLDNDGRTLARMASCHPDGAIWFGTPPKNPPLKVVQARGAPAKVLEKLLEQE